MIVRNLSNCRGQPNGRLEPRQAARARARLWLCGNRQVRNWKPKPRDAIKLIAPHLDRRLHSERDFCQRPYRLLVTSSGLQVVFKIANQRRPTGCVQSAEFATTLTATNRDESVGANNLQKLRHEAGRCQQEPKVECIAAKQAFLSVQLVATSVLLRQVKSRRPRADNAPSHCRPGATAGSGPLLSIHRPLIANQPACSRCNVRSERTIS